MPFRWSFLPSFSLKNRAQSTTCHFLTIFLYQKTIYSQPFLCSRTYHYLIFYCNSFVNLVMQDRFAISPFYYNIIYFPIRFKYFQICNYFLVLCALLRSLTSGAVTLVRSRYYFYSGALGNFNSQESGFDQIGPNPQHCFLKCL
jgi:hypothetical protein